MDKIKLILILSLKLTTTLTLEVNPAAFIPNESSQLGVRAVMIPCDIPEEVFPSESDATRFQREELFKHNALHDCKQKLAITIKMTSDPHQASGDEYIPIEHVLGVNRKKIRLLNPYVLRLRRKAPFQAYKLRKVDTVRGVIERNFDKEFIEIESNGNRIQRDLQFTSIKDEDGSGGFGVGSLVKLDHDGRQSYSTRNRGLAQLVHNKTTAKRLYSSCPKSQNLRTKRLIKPYEDNYAKWIETTGFTPANLGRVFDDNGYRPPPRDPNADKILYEDREPVFDVDDKNYEVVNSIAKDRLNKVMKQINSNSYDEKGIIPNMALPEFHKDKKNVGNNKHYKENNLESSLEQENEIKSEEKDFVIYEIGDPDLWYNAQIQLFEKLITSEGKTVWNDLMKDETARVNTANPEWLNQYVYVQYKPIEFLTRAEFVLPVTDLRLVVPFRLDHENIFKDKTGEFVIVHMDDVIPLDDPKEFSKRDDNSSTDASFSVLKEQRPRQVIVRSARALMGGSAENLKIFSRGLDRYLKLPHTKPHYAQMDLEAKADDNELILVGVFGRLTTIVSDTSRRVRSILTLQATNTGLAAARMRVWTRECSPQLLDSSIGKDEAIAGPLILPPKHTRTFILNLPLQVPVESANCTIALVNDDGESVAIRDVRIKRDDRCYCVWHCDCVCLSEDPKLLCRAMTAAQLMAAGLAIHHKSRHVRSACYPDVITLNFFVTFIGVLLALLLLGVMKAILGLIFSCVSSWGLPLLLQMPRKLDRYYESSLRNRRVVYDDEGWPVHPDTKKRTVRLVSLPMEFMLNMILFIILPCVMLWDAAKRMTPRCHVPDEYSETNNFKTSKTNKCYSSHDVQVTEARARRRRGLRKWMTPQAEELTTGLWHEGLTPLGKMTPACLQPLLRDDTGFRKHCEQSSFVDSEQDDTEYVLMQMQKSRESLARNQQQIETKTIAKNQRKDGSDYASSGHR